MNTARITGTVATLPACLVFGAYVGAASGVLLGATYGLLVFAWGGSGGSLAVLPAMTLLGGLIGAFSGAVGGILGRVLGGRTGWTLGGLAGATVGALPFLGPGFLAVVSIGALIGLATGDALERGTSRFRLLRRLLRATDNWDHLATVATVSSRAEAERMRAALRSEGVFCYLSGGSLNRFAQGVPIQVQVNRKDAERVPDLLGRATELEFALPPEGRGTEMEASAPPAGRGTEPEAAGRP